MTKTDPISDQEPTLWTNLIAQYKKIRNSVHFQKPNENDKFELSATIVQPFKGDQKKGRIQPENFCVCAPENCPLQGRAESWTYWATI